MIYTLILLALAAALDAVQDVLKSSYSSSILDKLNPKFWNPEVSYINKWKDGIDGGKPRFFGATTFLSFLTDGWHLAKFLMLTCLFASIAFYNLPLTIFHVSVTIIACSIVWGISFEINYRLLHK